MLVSAKEELLDKVINIIFAGKGGSGIFTAAEICAQAAFLSGFDVKTGGSKGIAQRGGTVVSHMKYGKKVFSPKIEMGQADFAVSIGANEISKSYLDERGVLIKLECEVHGNYKKFSNIYLLGQFSSCLPFKEEQWHIAVKNRFIGNLAEENLKVFLEGRKLCIKKSVV